jgi:hypothetical protein
MTVSHRELFSSGGKPVFGNLGVTAGIEVTTGVVVGAIVGVGVVGAGVTTGVVGVGVGVEQAGVLQD